MYRPVNGFQKGVLKLSAVLFTCILAAGAFALPQCAAADAPGGNFIFILDASGSMGARMQDRSKMDVAKEVLASLIKDLPATARVGLTAYGHRQKGDCADVEQLVPPGPVNKDGLIKSIRGLNPRGMTPITYAVRKVAEGLKGAADETTIVLVSDGEETCKGDPCAVVAELKASGIKFVMHVIGFDVTEKEKAQLACIARAGGGFYFTARNAGELKLAAKQAVEKAAPAAGSLTIKALRDGKPFRARFEIRKGDGDPASGGKLQEGWLENGSGDFQLPPGSYDATVRAGEGAGDAAVLFQGIAVEPGRKVEKTADFSGGILKVRAVRNGKPCRAWCALYKAGAGAEKLREAVTGDWAGDGPASFRLAPGTYDVEVENREDADRPVVALRGIAVESGKGVEKTAQFSGGTLKLRALRNDKPFRAFCMIFKAGREEGKERQKVAEGWIEPDGTSYPFTQGAYDVIVENQEDAGTPTAAFQGVAVEAGKTVEKVADFSGGTLRIVAQRNGKPLSAYCRVLKAGAGPGKEKEAAAETWTSVEGTALKLRPGIYDVIVENREDAGNPTRIFTGIAIENGKTVEKIAEFSGGSLTVKATRNGQPISAYCTVFDAAKGAGKKEVAGSHTGEDGVEFQLLPGTYDIEVENQDNASRPRVSFKGVAVEAGKSVEKTAEFSGGTLTVKATRNGKPLSAYCTVYETGEGGKREVAGSHTGEDGVRFQLLPGSYDVEVENQDDASRPRLSFKGVTIEVGKTVEKTAEFSGGTLTVKAVRNGQAFSAYCTVFEAAEGAGKKEVAGSHTGEDGVEFQLLPGTYDIEVEDQADASRPRLRFKGITVQAGKSVTKTAEFTGGSLMVKAVRNGQPFSAYCTVFEAGDGGGRKEVTGGHTGEDGVEFMLLPGTYDIEVENQEDAGRPRQSIKGIKVEAGKTVERTAEFTGGTLKVKAVRNAEVFSAYCTVYTGGEGGGKKEVTGGHTGEDGVEFMLLPGTYDIEVENQDDATRPRQSIKGIRIEAGRTVEKTVEFIGGTLTVKAVRNGEVFSAYCTVYTGGEGSAKKEVTGGHTGDDGVEFHLPPGTYILSVEDQESRVRKEMKDVKLDAGKTRLVEVKF